MENVFGLNSSSSIEMWLNGTQIYSNTLWYGVKFTGNSTIGTRTGNMYMHKNLPIQSNMKGCTITSNGTVKYLNPTDWTKYEDGTERDMTLNTMVEIPAHSILFIVTADYVEVRLSPYYLPGFVEVKKQYVSAYETYCEGGVAKSIKDQIPTVNTTRESFQTQSRANGSIHWNMYTYEAHKAITWLFVVEHANRNSQANFNPDLTVEGYHQGGLGAGVTNGTNSGAYSYVPTGTTDSLGNGTGVVSYAASAITTNVPRYRGIENPFGHIWKNVIDVIFYGTDNGIYVNKDYTTFSNNRADNEFLTNNFTSNGYLANLVNTPAGDLFAGTNATSGGSSTIYYCDYHYTNAITSDRTLLIGGRSGNGTHAGLFFLDSSGALGYSHANVGSRLTYLI